MHPLRVREMSGDAVETLIFSRIAEIVDEYVRHLTSLPPQLIEEIHLIYHRCDSFHRCQTHLAYNIVNIVHESVPLDN